MNLVTLALRNLQRRPMRSIIVTASVGLAVASALSLVALAGSIERGVSEGIDERGADLTVLQRKASDIFSGFISEEMKGKVSTMRGVENVAGELIMFAPIDRDQQKLVAGWAPDSFLLKRMPMIGGSIPRLDERRTAILGNGAAETLRKKVGDYLDILDERFRVVGIANYQSAVNRSMIFVPLRDLQEIAFRQGQVTLLDVKLSSSLTAAQIESIKTEIEQAGPLLVTPTDELLRNDRNLTIMKAISRTVSLIALTMGTLAVMNVLLMAVQERIGEVGIMMALGWTKVRIMTSIVIEGVLIGFSGSITGVGIAYGLSFLFTSAPIIGEIVSFRPTPEMVLPTLAIAIVLCCIGSLYPAWRAASMNPTDALRRI